MWTVLSKDRARAKTKWRKKDHTQVVAAKCDRPVIRWSVQQRGLSRSQRPGCQCCDNQGRTREGPGDAIVRISVTHSLCKEAEAPINCGCTLAMLCPTGGDWHHPRCVPLRTCCRDSGAHSM